MNIRKENIKNLTGLWKLVGKKANGFHAENDLEYCKIDFSDWPNRIWFLDKTDTSGLKKAREIIEKSETKLKLTAWHNLGEESDNFPEKEGFESISEQMGMSIELSKKYNITSKINLVKVDNQARASLWSELFHNSFNYEINRALVFMSRDEVDYFIAYHEDQVVGTCLLFYQKKKVIGIHSLGIIPEMRRKGFAEEIMRILLNKSIDNGFQYATLQASAMAKQMYEKLGFSTQFIITNYQLKK